MEDTLRIPLTIEEQLERYVNTSKHSHHERYEVLWHAWNQNKRWITQLLQGTMLSFPTYSRHDETHAQTVLHNIEMILGEKRVALLSATDCFMLLHTVYIHDIGMLITASEQKEIVANDSFLKMVDYLEEEGDGSLKRAVEALKRREYCYGIDDKYEYNKRLYRDKLEIYYAFTHLLATYRRKEHGEKSRDILYEWTKESDKLGAGFSLAGIPQRIFLTVAECAKMHTEVGFDSIMELPQEDDGYVFDYIHPRFVSVLLALGDILDMDNDRFHPLAMLSADSIPELSMAHYRKHLSIRRLHIRPELIEIAADCENQEALRLVRRECDMLTSILQQAGYAWPGICPADFPGTLPTMGEVELRLLDQKIPKELVSAKFNIPQKKAFEILEGANLYTNRFIFLREFLQNAIDATKIQYWKEYKSAILFHNKKDKDVINSPYDLEKYVSTAKFPIEVEMELCKQDREHGVKSISMEDIRKIGEEICTYGVNVKIKDLGIGIGRESILRIASVGTSTNKQKKIISEMPGWLKPTAEFGVGLQSAFLVVSTFKCNTHTRSDEHYEITFGSGALAQYEGYINVKPIDLEEKDDAYGTCFEIFISEDKKMNQAEFPVCWEGQDVFSEDYAKMQPIRHSGELMFQMISYLDSIIGEVLFPIHVNVKEIQGIKMALGMIQKKVRAIKLNIWKENGE